MDYEHFTMDATFTSTVSQVCGTVQTKMDSIYETFEVFSVSLSVVANLRVRLGTQKTIRIIDGHSKSEITDFFLSIHSLALTGAVVSLVNPTIVQNEGDGDVSVCARLDSPAGGTEREIFITLNNSELINRIIDYYMLPLNVSYQSLIIYFLSS